MEDGRHVAHGAQLLDPPSIFAARSPSLYARSTFTRTPVQADMPGVSKDGLSIQADRNSLVIEGNAVIDVPAAMEAIHAEVQATRYRRSFALSGELDAERIEATLKNGVLTLRIPKRAEFRPRKVEVRVG